MGVLRVRTTRPADEASAIATVVLAFSTDPVARWCWPDPHQYVANMPGFIRAFAGGAFEHNGAYCSDDHAGAALWLPPNVHSDEEALGEIMQRTLESTNPRNISLYQRHGFEVLATVKVGTSPPFVPMLRGPR